ncbi:MAG: hypothetical protein LPK45_05210, partial [Bacteroidota bacterium]|nr:hypothetical protein [Bacteroidota bacterium]MDX5430457.1 hypothetical protein [Bacteroidota bacterium]MDX5469218.1 hypothetical protein [Bacteroidota bacterium]
MKEQDFDQLERLFRDGLKNLEHTPDDSVWQGVRKKVKPKNRFWIYLGLGAVISCIVASVLLFQNDQENTNTILTDQQDQTQTTAIQEGTNGYKNENTNPVGANPNGVAEASSESASTPEIGTPQNPSTINSKQNEKTNTPTAQNSQNTPSPDGPNQPGAATKKNPSALTDHGDTKPNPHTSGREPNPQEPATNAAPNQNPTGGGKTTTDPVTGPVAPPILQPKMELATILSKPQTIGTPQLTAQEPLSIKERNEEPKKPSVKENQRYLYLEFGTLIPSVKNTYHLRGDFNFDKTNQNNFGWCFQGGYTHQWQKGWLLRTGLGIQHYQLKGQAIYYGKIDTLEWIDRNLNRGFVIRDRTEMADYQVKYT